MPMLSTQPLVDDPVAVMTANCSLSEEAGVGSVGVTSSDVIFWFVWIKVIPSEWK